MPFNEAITTDFQEAQNLLKRKMEKVRKSVERKEKERDVMLKEGP